MNHHLAGDDIPQPARSNSKAPHQSRRVFIHVRNALSPPAAEQSRLSSSLRPLGLRLHPHGLTTRSAPSSTAMSTYTQGNSISVDRVINASATAIFGLLRDPGKHSRFDGSGTVNSALAPDQLSLGSTFVMSMRAAGTRFSCRTEPLIPSSSSSPTAVSPGRRLRSVTSSEDLSGDMNSTRPGAIRHSFVRHGTSPTTGSNRFSNVPPRLP